MLQCDCADNTGMEANNKGHTMNTELVARAQRLAGCRKTSAPITDARISEAKLRGAEFAHERSDCAVRAIHMATRLTYAEAHALCKAHGRPDRCGMYERDLCRALESIGAESTLSIARTFGQLLEVCARGVHLVMVTGHFVTIVDGRIVSDGWPVSKSKRMQSCRIWKTQD